MSEKKNITIVGTGYVGLTTAVMLANAGYKVFTLDIDQKKIDVVKTGKSYFYEPSLDIFVEKAIKSGNLIPTTSYKEAIPSTDIVLSCVGTPDREDGSSNLDYIFAAAESVVTNTKKDLIYVQKSTVPVGTGKSLLKFMKGKNAKVTMHYVSNPEFLAESTAVFDTLFFDRLVVGADNEEARKIVVNIFKDLDSYAKGLEDQHFGDYIGTYKNFSKKDLFSKTFEEKVISTNIESAELIKVTANAFLALKISFANSIAKLADVSGANISQVMDGVGSDIRIGRSFLYAGLGWGGGCFPKDVHGLIHTAKEHGVELSIMNKAVDVNNSMVPYTFNKLKKLKLDKKSDFVTVLGLSFKAGTSDVRKSQSIKLANYIREKGYKVVAYDPHAMEEAKELLNKQITLKQTIEEAIDGTSCVILATEWKEFINFNWEINSKLFKKKNIIDARNKLNQSQLTKQGFVYCGIGQDKSS